MNYYPNYYNYNPNPYVSVPTYQPQPPSLNGKIVDSADIVRVTEVPVGGYGVFPKADMSEVYIKTWSPDGTTQVTTYKPSTPAPPVDFNTQLLEKIAVLESKIDNILTQQTQKEVATNDTKPIDNKITPEF